MRQENFFLLQTTPLLVATHNKGKAAEIINQLKKCPTLVIKTIDDFALQSPQEPYQTFKENAAWKARYAMEHTGLITLADDSGLAVPALDGQPGVATADWFTHPNTGQRCFDTGLQRLNMALKGKDRTAYLIATLALAFPSGDCYFFEHQIDGQLLAQPQGEGGFGFDPLFKPQGYEITFAQMPAQLRASLSPRARAAQKIYQILQSQG